MASNTGCTSVGDWLITFRMSAVAVRCSSASLGFVEQPHVLDRDDGLVGEGHDEGDLLVVERDGISARGDNMTPMTLPSRTIGAAIWEL